MVQHGDDVYCGLVIDAGWTVLSYQAWLFTTLVQQLLGRSKPEKPALQGLSFASPVDS